MAAGAAEESLAPSPSHRSKLPGAAAKTTTTAATLSSGAPGHSLLSYGEHVCRERKSIPLQTPASFSPTTTLRGAGGYVRGRRFRFELLKTIVELKVEEGGVRKKKRKGRRWLCFRQTPPHHPPTLCAFLNADRKNRYKE